MAKKNSARSVSRQTRKASPSVKRKKAGAPAPLRLESGEILIRMYRQGLGDCFLLSFGTGTDDEPIKILIDCGVHSRQTDGPKRLGQVMADVSLAAENHLHVVVATHEHADHLSGFVQKGSPFLLDDLAIDELWVAWTEQPDDRQAGRLRKKHRSARKVIEKAVEEARQKAAQGNGRTTGLAESLLGLSDFERPAANSVDEKQAMAAIDRLSGNASQKTGLHRLLDEERDTTLGAVGKKSAKVSSNELALALLGVKAKRTVYCEPQKTPLRVPGAKGVKAFILGPPRNEQMLKKDLPTKSKGQGGNSDDEHQFQEVYLSGQGDNRTVQLSPALGERDELGAYNNLGDDFRYPFVDEFRLPYQLEGDQGVAIPEQREKQSAASNAKEFFRKHYFSGDVPGAGRTDWRRVDDDWLTSVEQLALNLDSDTNNTSLVLAFDLGTDHDNRVLLFPGDAQVGNWLSWRDQTFSDGNRTCSADELLSRTVIYKVGHHGSHNATIKCDPRDTSRSAAGAPFGLELMEDIIALVPVDRAAADKPMPQPWKMPHLPLYRRLREKARRRVLRSDLELAPLNEKKDDPDICPESTGWKAVPGMPGIQWRTATEEFTDGTPGPLYYDILLSGSAATPLKPGKKPRANSRKRK